MFTTTDNESVICRNRELEAILEVSMVLTASFVPEDNLGKVMTILSERLDMQRGCVFLLDKDSQQLRIVASHGLAPEEISKGKYRIGEGIVGQVIETGSEVLIPDIGEDPRFLNKTGSRISREGISFISVPVRLEDETFGVITVDRIYAREHGSMEDDLRVLRIISSLMAQFLKLLDRYHRSEKEKARLKVQLEDRYNFPNIIGVSEKFQSVLKTVVKVADTEATVLLLGESGTGKELIARTLHYQSRRADSPYVAVNCATLPENLIEAELFGVEKGAYTGASAQRAGRFELAAGGTIFLDEIGELPIEVQAKLLRVLQERVFERVGSSKSRQANVRVITATNRKLEEEIIKGTFREDLYWRLNVVPIVLPPLRERRDDIGPLIRFYTEKFCAEYSKQIMVAPDAMEEFSRYDWPGNIRELANTMERLVIMNDCDMLEAAMLPSNLRKSMPGGGVAPPANGHPDGPCGGLCGEVEVLEREKIIIALKDNNYVQIRAARALGITPRQLGYRIKKYAIKI